MDGLRGCSRDCRKGRAADVVWRAEAEARAPDDVDVFAKFERARRRRRRYCAFRPRASSPSAPRRRRQPNAYLLHRRRLARSSPPRRSPSGPRSSCMCALRRRVRLGRSVRGGARRRGVPPGGGRAAARPGRPSRSGRASPRALGLADYTKLCVGGGTASVAARDARVLPHVHAGGAREARRDRGARLPLRRAAGRAARRVHRDEASPQLLAVGGGDDAPASAAADPRPVLAAVTRGLRRGEAAHPGIRVNQLLCMICWHPEWSQARNASAQFFGAIRRNSRRAILSPTPDRSRAGDGRLRAEHRDAGGPCAVVGVDVAAGEAWLDPSSPLHAPTVAALADARRRGLPITLHAGEEGGAENVLRCARASMARAGSATATRRRRRRRRR